MSQPTFPQLQHAILDHFHETISRFPPSHAPGMLSLSRSTPRLGDYLVNLGYLLPRQLDSILYDWHQHAAPSPRPLGCLIVARDLLPANVLSMVLLLQTLDYLEHAANNPRFLGERLLIDGYVTPQQLAVVLEEQVVRYQQGKWIRLGDLIVKHGWLEPSILKQQNANERASYAHNPLQIRR